MTHPALTRGGLYAITDGPRTDLLTAAESSLAGGAGVLQYRDTNSPASRRLHEARALAALCQRFEVPLLIADDVALATAIGAAGVHLSRKDCDISTARHVLGRAAIIGVSCFDDVDRARAMVAAGADYVSFGAFFLSPTLPQAHIASPERLRQTVSLGVPRVAIGGITPDNGAALIEAGADYLAAISGLFGAADIRHAAMRYAALFTNTQQDYS